MIVQPGTYRHFSGGLCTVLAAGQQPGICDELVVYADDSGTVYVRPLAEFTEVVERDGYHGPRFVRQADSD